MSARPEVAVGAIAFDESGRVLLVQRATEPAKGQWTVPGGRVELGEKMVAACAREVREETGLSCTVGPMVAVVERMAEQGGGELAYHFVIVDYLVSVESGDPVAASDAAQVAWLPWDELEGAPLTEGLLPILEQARALWQAGH